MRDGFQRAVVRRHIAHGVRLLQGGAGLLWELHPVRDWFSGAVVCRHIAHGVLLPQEEAGLL